ncbi:protein spaetzle-like [Culicoides brevitarsis]|uniref:protein spaetzle-like n=1 Tax=Culicoides brevitarsis TaxID=469753 RepID=UPI00307BF54D
MLIRNQFAWSCCCLLLFLVPEIFAVQCLDPPHCENVRGYPLQTIQTTVNREFDKYAAFFGEDPIYTTPMVINRFNPGPFVDPKNAVVSSDDSHLCNFSILTKFPKFGTTNTNEELLIINDGQNYRQGVRVELCQNDNSKCLYSDSFPNGYECTCEQQYHYRYLLSYDNNKVVKKAFRMPSYCKPSIKTKDATRYN